MDEAFPIELIPPDTEETEWTARAVGHETIGDTAEEALSNLGELLDDIVEDAEYYRIHAPGVYGHTTGSQVPEGHGRHGVQLPKGQGSEPPSPFHQNQPPQNRV